MLADYVMKSIDNLFQSKLSLQNNSKKNTSNQNYNNTKNNNDRQDGNDLYDSNKNKATSKSTSNAFFSKDYIKENLHRVIKKNYDQE
jgi:hypothetical protein